MESLIILQHAHVDTLRIPEVIGRYSTALQIKANS